MTTARLRFPVVWETTFPERAAFLSGSRGTAA
jgi:hypothetical protein